MKAVAVICLSLLVTVYGTKTLKDVADCFHGVLRECRQTSGLQIDDEHKREAVSQCFIAEAERVRTATRTCLEGKDVQNTIACFTIPHKDHLKGLAAGMLKFSPALRENLKDSAKTFKDCLAGKEAVIQACHEGCPEAAADLQTKFNECTSASRETFPSPTAQTCLDTAFSHAH